MASTALGPIHHNPIVSPASSLFYLPISLYFCQNRNTSSIFSLLSSVPRPLSSVLVPTALSLINQAYEEGWEELDLSGMELTELSLEGDRSINYKIN
jgi:hypothetical protein